jgi:hypothetical protein
LQKLVKKTEGILGVKQIWAVLVSFGQFWAEIAALTVAESLPKVWLKSLEPHNS